MEYLDARTTFNKDSPTGCCTDFSERNFRVYDEDPLEDMEKIKGSDNVKVGCSLSRWVVL